MPTQVLILCTANSARSQMAEGLLRHLAGEQVAVYSAGSHPATVHPLAIQAMGEMGVDLHSHRSKHFGEFIHHPFEYVITVCDHAAEACPLFPGAARRLHWSFPDPAAAAGDEAARLQAFQQTRDAIRQRLEGWITTDRPFEPQAREP